MMISTAKGFERYRRGLHKNESICLIIRLESMLVLPDQRTELFTLNQGFNTIASESRHAYMDKMEGGHNNG